MRTLKLYGPLAKKFGAEHSFDAASPAQLIRALQVNRPGFKKALRKGHYALVAGDLKTGRSVRLNELAFPISRREQTLHLIPKTKVAGFDPFTVALFFIAGAAVAATVAILLMPKVPGPNPNDREKDDKNSYVFDGPVNVSEQGHPVPLIYGRCRVGSVVISSAIQNTRVVPNAVWNPGGDTSLPFPGLLGMLGVDWNVDKGESETRASVEEPNTLQSQATARVVDLLSEGEIGGLVNGLKSVYFDDTPVQNSDDTFNFKGIELTQRVGTPDQASLPGFPDQETTNPVGIEVTVTAGPIVQTITNVNANRARITLRIPALYETDSATGDMKSTTVAFKISVQADGGGYEDVLTHTFNDKNTAPYDEDFEFDLQPGGAPWDVKVTRLTADSASATLQNKTIFQALTEIIDAKLTYPDSALIGLVVDARQFGTSIPNRAYLVDGIKVQIPSNYNPVTRAYTGDWDGTFIRATTSNPAWVVYDLCTSKRYGLGRLLGAVPDKFDLYAIAQYCDQLVDDGYGGTEPRFQINGVLNTRGQALTLIRQVCDAFNSLLYASSTSIRVIQDAPEVPSTAIVGANTIDGEIEYSGTSNDGLYSAWIVAFTDTDDAYRLGYEVVEDEDLLQTIGWRPQEVTRFMCTSRGEALRYGRRMRDDQRYKTHAAKWGAGPDHGFVSPGEIVEVNDGKFTEERWGGLVMAATTTSITIDKGVTIDSGRAYSLKVTMPDGTLTTKAVTTTAGTNKTVLTWSGALATAPRKGAIWSLHDDIVTPRQFRVLGVRERRFGEYDVTAELYDPNKYDRIELGLKIEPATFTNLPVGSLAAPTAIEVVEFLKQDGNSNVPSVQISLTTGVDPRVTAYDIAYRAPGALNWVPIYGGGTLWRELINVTPGLYDFRARAKDNGGRVGPWFNRLDVELFGSDTEAGMPAVSGLVLFSEGDNATFELRWTKPSDVRPFFYEVFRNTTSTFATATLIGTASEERYSISAGGYYWVRTKYMASEGAEGSPVHVTGGDFLDLRTDLDAIIGTVTAAPGIPPVATLPVSGTLNEIVFLTTDSKLYTWNGSAWEPLVADPTPGSTGVETAATLPTVDNYEGRTVLLTTTNKLYVYNGGAFEPVVGDGTTGGTVGVESGSTLPSTGLFTGRLFFLTTDNVLYRYTGSAWTSAVASTAITGSITDAQIAALATTKLTGTIATAQIAAGAVTNTQLATNAVQAGNITDNILTAAKFTSTVRPVEVFASLPGSGNFAGRTVFLTSDNKLYRHNGTTFISTTAAGDVTGTLSDSQIADLAATKLTGQVVASQITDGVITAAKMTATARPVEVLGTLPGSGNFEGRMVYLTTDDKLYRYTGSAYVSTTAAADVTGTLTNAQIADLATSKLTGTIATAQIANSAIDATKLAGSISAVEIFATNPVTGNFEGRTIYNSTDKKLYRYNGSAYISATAAADVTGTLTNAQIADLAAAKITGTLIDTQIASGAITASKFASGLTPVEVLASLPGSGNFAGRTVFLTSDSKLYRYNGSAFISTAAAADITGTLTNSQIADLAATKVTGTLTNAQIADLAATKITGTIASSQIADGAIGSAKLAAGLSPIEVLATLPATGNYEGRMVYLTTDDKLYRHTGSPTNASGFISTSAAADITGTLATAQIATGAINATLIAAGAVGSSQLAAGAVIAGKITAGSIVAADLQANTITASQIAAGTVTATQIAAGTITATQISAGTITGDRIAAGTITAAYIAASTITTNKLYMTDWSNLTEDPYGANSGSWLNGAGPALYAQTTTHPVATTELRVTTAGYSVQQGTAMIAKQGDSFRLKADIAASSDALADIQLLIREYTSAGAFLTSTVFSFANIGTSWVERSCLLSVTNASTGLVRLGMFVNSLASGYVSMTNIMFRRAAGAELIVDGSITAAAITASTITGDKIAANTITATKLILGDTSNAYRDADMQDATFYTVDTGSGALSGTSLASGSTKRYIGVAQTGAQTLTTGSSNVEPNKNFYFTATVGRDTAVSGNPTIDLYLDWYSIDAGAVETFLSSSTVGSVVAVGTSHVMSGIFAAPSTARRVKVRVVKSATAGNSSLSLAGPVLRRAAAAELIVDGTITAAKITANTITASEIAAGAITTTELAAGAVTAAKITAGTITATEIAATTITGAKIAANTIAAGNLVANTITAGQIAAGAITASRLTITGDNDIIDAYFTDAATSAAYWTLNSGVGWVRETNTTNLTNRALGAPSALTLDGTTASGSGQLNALSPLLPVKPSGVYEVEITGWSNTAKTVFIRLDYYDNTGTSLGTNSSGITISNATHATTTTNKLQVTVGSTVAYVRLAVYKFSGVSWTGTDQTTVSGAKLREANQASMIVDGTIVAAKIAANTITAAKILAGTITAAEIAAGTITSDRISAGTIQADRIASGVITATQIAANTITAGQIAAATITATQIAAATITTSKLYMSDFANLTEDPYGASAASWSLTTASVNQSTTHPVAPSEMRITAAVGAINTASFIPAKTGDTFRVKVDMKSSADAAADVQLTVWQYNAAGTFLTSDSVLFTDVTTSWTSRTAMVTCNNAGCVKVRIGVYVPSLASGYVSFTNMMFRRAAGAELIVDGTVTATHIAANTITAGQIQAGTITATQIASNTITATQIAAGTITATEIAGGTITGAKITAGTLTAGLIAAGAITASKLYITDTSNMVADVNFLDSAYWSNVNWTFGSTDATAIAALAVASGIKTATGNGTTTQAAGFLAPNFSGQAAVEPGKSYRLSAKWFAKAGFTGRIYVVAAWYKPDGTTQSTDVTNWEVSGADYRTVAAVADTSGTCEGLKVAPADAGFVRFQFVVVWSTTLVNAQYGFMAQPRLSRAVSGELIVDGSITAAKITANTITAAQISAGTLTAAEIAAGTITASKLYVTDNSNLCGDVFFNDTAMWTFTGGWAYDTSTDITTSLNAPKGVKLTATGANPQAASNMIFGNSVRYIAVEPSKAYRLAISTFTKTAFKGRLSLIVNWYNQAGTFISGATVATGTDFRTVAAASNVASTLDGIVTSLSTAAYMGFYVTCYWPAAAASAGVACVAIPRVHRGTSAELIVDGTITAAKIFANTITAGQIAAGTITATQIQTGTLTAGLIAAGAITASKLAITDSQNMLVDADFLDSAYWTFSAGTGAAFGSTDAIITSSLGSKRGYKGPNGDGTLTSNFYTCANSTANYILVEPGKSYRIACKIAASTGTTMRGYLQVNWYKQDGSASSITANSGVNGIDYRTTAAVGTQVGAAEGLVVAPADAYYCAFIMVIGTSTTLANAGNIYFALPRMYRAVSGELIVDGTITASKITAATITATQIAAGTITASLIAAGTITASRLLVTPESKTPDPYFLDDSLWFYTSAGWVKETTAATLNARAFGAPGGVTLSSANHTGTGADKFVGGSGIGGGSGGIPIKGGTVYEFEIVGWSNTTNVVSARIAQYTAGGTVTGAYISVGAQLFVSSANSSSTTVQRVQFTADATAAVAYVQVYKYAAATWSAGNEATISGVQLREANTASMIVDGTLTSSKIAAGTIQADRIAAGVITANEIATGTITAAKIQTGTITAGLLATSAISASKLVIGDFSNMLMDPHFSDTTAWNLSSGVGTTATYDTTTETTTTMGIPVSVKTPVGNGTTSQGGARSVSQPSAQYSAVEGGKAYRFTAKVLVKNTFTGRVRIVVDWYKQDKTTTASTAFNEVTGTDYRTTARSGGDLQSTIDGILTPPADAVWCRFCFFIDWSTTQNNASYALMGAPRMHRAIDVNLIVDGTITAAKIQAGTITSDRISAGTIQADRIASGVITATQISAGSITGDRLTAGTITASQIAANTITASKLVLGDHSNMILDPDLLDASYWSMSTGGVFGTTEAPEVTTELIVPRAVRSQVGNGTTTQAAWGIDSALMPVLPGAYYRVAAKVNNRTAFTGQTSIGLEWYDRAGTYISLSRTYGNNYKTTANSGASVIQTLAIQYQAPTTAYYAKFRAFVDWSTTQANSASGRAYFGAIRVQRAVDTALIVDGAITASKIMAGEVTADRLVASAGIYLGTSSELWPVQLQSKEYLLADGETVSYGLDFGTAADLDWDATGLPTTAAGERYDIKATSNSGTGFTSYMKKVVSGGFTTYTQTTDAAAGGADPARTANAANALPATDGNYTIRLQGNVVVGSFESPDPADFKGPPITTYLGILPVDIYFYTGSAWVLADTVAVSLTDSPTGVRAYDQTFVVNYTGAVATSGKAYGATPENTDGGNSLSDITSVSYQAEAASGATAVTTKIRWTVKPKQATI